jgi:hypothetical protein
MRLAMTAESYPKVLRSDLFGAVNEQGEPKVFSPSGRRRITNAENARFSLLPLFFWSGAICKIAALVSPQFIAALPGVLPAAVDLQVFNRSCAPQILSKPGMKLPVRSPPV